jgi:hypothetical protein
VSRDPVQAHQRRPGGVAELVDVQPHGREPTARGRGARPRRPAR